MNFDAIGAAWAPRLLSVLRIMSGLLLLQHGTGKLLKFPAGVVPANFNLVTMPGYAGIIEFVCGILLVIGLFGIINRLPDTITNYAKRQGAKLGAAFRGKGRR